LPRLQGFDIVDWTPEPSFPRQEVVLGQRLAALCATEQLGAPTEERFDRLTRLVRRLLHAPVALVLLLDADRQFFLSTQGLPGPWARLRETPLSHSFCRSVVETGLPMSVSDAREDPRIRGNPAVEELGVVACLAMPLALSGGCIVGALCAIDQEPRAWTPEDEQVLADVAGAVTGEITAGLRLQELEAADAALRESEKRYRTLFEAIDTGFCIIEMKFDAEQRPIDYRFVEVNHAFASQTGLAEVAGKWMRDLAPDHEQHWFDIYGRVALTGEPLRFENVAAALHRWYDVYAFRIDEPAARRVGVLFHDISDRKRTEAALRESEARLRDLLATLDLGTLMARDLSGTITFWSAGCARLYGWTAEEAIGRNAYELLCSTLPAPQAEIEAALERDGEWVGDLRQRARDGREMVVTAHKVLRRGPDGRPAAVLEAVTDVTTQRQAEAALRESEARLRLAQEVTAIETWEWDPETDETLWMPEKYALFGLDLARDDPMTYPRLLDEIVHPDDRAKVETAVYEALATGRTYECVFRTRRRCPDGEREIRWIIARGRRIRRTDGSPGRMIGVTVDITERQAAEARLQELRAELLHVSRLSAAGQMASALAHELNQPLTAATSAIRAAQRMLAASPTGAAEPPVADVREAMDLAAEQALWAGQIVRRLRDFVARGEADKRPNELTRLIEEAAALALVDARERGIQVAFRFGAGLPAVLVDRIQIQQVLFNLVRNAVEAMTDIAPRGEGMPPRRSELVVTAASAGPKAVEVTISDTGPGFAPEITARLFEAFVSTKPGGMGMGLAICRSIIEAHDGTLWAEPNPGGGAVFRFILPTLEADAY
jgi:two-component system, LuxR family, sensor kinase FixL